VRNNKQKNTDH